MGVIRLLLALAVVISHSSGHDVFTTVYGSVAVQSFFIISGFYIAMVYRKNYSSVVNFWLSRYLRLLPVYLTCAATALYLGRNQIAAVYPQLPFTAFIYLIFTNTTMIFQDLALFLGANREGVVLTAGIGEALWPLHHQLLIPQAWSLGLEISFYLLAPFIVISKKRLAWTILISILLRILLVHRGYSFDPWSYRFFPNELSLFLSGSCAYMLFTANWLKRVPKLSSLCILLGIVLYIAFYQAVPMQEVYRKILLYTLLIVSIPLVFELTRYSKIDSFLGLLSYPIYCCHLLIITYLMPKLQNFSNGDVTLETLYLIIVVILISIGLYHTVDKPFDYFRQRFKNSTETGDITKIR